MKRFFTTAFLVVLISVLGLKAQEPVKITFVIDGQNIENFDGSQLLGKTIASYTVVAERNIHVILTTDFTGGKSVESTKVVVTTSEAGEDEQPEDKAVISVYSNEVVYVVDGKVIPPEEFKLMSSDDIASVRVINSTDDNDFKKYAETSTTTVMLFISKQAALSEGTRP